jgi:probable HAF family extracellular repeat protein
MPRSAGGLRLQIAVGGLGFLTALAGTHAQCEYAATVFPLYPVDCGVVTNFTTVLDENKSGVRVGFYKCQLWYYPQAFVWTPEQHFTPLEPPPGVLGATARQVNDDGQIVGTYTVAGIGDRGFVFEGGQFTELPPLADGAHSWANANNNSGTVVGARCFEDGPAPYGAFIWSDDQGFLDLGIMNGPFSSAVDINDAGQVVGWTGDNTSRNKEAFLWQDGNLTLLGAVPGGFSSWPWAISEDGAIVGTGMFPVDGEPDGVNRAFLWKDGQFTMLGTLPGHLRSAAFDVRSGVTQVVGAAWSVDGNPNVQHGFLWQNGVMTDLNDLVDPDLLLSMNDGRRINSEGQIIAYGYTSDGSRTIFLTPLDLPIGDLDDDCRVSVLDFLLLLANWGPCPTGGDCPADFDEDGAVGLSDFWILVDNWG